MISFIFFCRAAGAVILGKTNVPEGCTDLQTFNEAFGKTSNPYDTSLTGEKLHSCVCAMQPSATLKGGSILGAWPEVILILP